MTTAPAMPTIRCLPARRARRRSSCAPWRSVGRRRRSQQDLRGRERERPRRSACGPTYPAPLSPTSWPLPSHRLPPRAPRKPGRSARARGLANPIASNTRTPSRSRSRPRRATHLAMSCLATVTRAARARIVTIANDLRPWRPARCAPVPRTSRRRGRPRLVRALQMGDPHAHA